MKQTFIKISKKNATKEDLDKLKKLLDDAGLKYYVVGEIEE